MPFVPSWIVRWSTGTRETWTIPQRILELAQGGVPVGRPAVRRLGSDAPALSPAIPGGGAGDGRLEFSALEIEPLGPEAPCAGTLAA